MAEAPLSLETERLRMRPLTESDAPFILELVNEPAWLEFIGDRGVRTMGDARAYIQNGPVAMDARLGIGLLAVEEKSGGGLVGICGLIQRDTLPDVDIGFAFLERVWGRGYAREAAAAVLAHGFHVHRLARIVALTARGNERSEKLLGKLGFNYLQMVQFKPGHPESRLWSLVRPA